MGFNPQYNPAIMNTGFSMMGGMQRDRQSSAMDKMAKDADDEKQRKEKERKDLQMMKGFKALHEASPELRKIAPVDDWGDVTPNQVRGMMQGLEFLSEDADRRETEAQITAGQAMGRQGFSPEEMGVPRAVPGLEGQAFVPTSRGGGQLVSTRGREEMPDLPPIGTEIGNLIYTGDPKGEYEQKRGGGFWDMPGLGAMGQGSGGREQRAEKKPTKKQFVKEFRLELKRAELAERDPTPLELETARQQGYWEY